MLSRMSGSGECRLNNWRSYLGFAPQMINCPLGSESYRPLGGWTLSYGLMG